MSVNWGQTPLTRAQRQQDYRTAVRLLRAEKDMRQQMFRHKLVHLVAKVCEIDQVLAILKRWKDELKGGVCTTGQPGLFEGSTEQHRS